MSKNKMKADITMRNLRSNPSLMNFFLRNQASEQLDELLEKVEEDEKTVFEAIESYSEDLDEVEGILYDETLQDIIEMFGLTLQEEDEEDDEEEDEEDEEEEDE